jgi:hypothetical protein
VHTLIIKAKDGEGRPLFTLEHKRDLMHTADPDVVARIVSQISRPRTVDEMEKKSTATPDSTSATS